MEAPAGVGCQGEGEAQVQLYLEEMRLQPEAEEEDGLLCQTFRGSYNSWRIRCRAS